ncbi:hypothetical protein KFE80_03055 [bacterium SCSIO 12696]|nr:hypothetical protein KFE80_03055 [bacterium SCSIO 12696]
MKITTTLLTLVAGGAFFVGAANADEVQIPVGQQAPEKQSLEKPRNGETKQQVQDKFGEPQKQNGPVGDPPISSWEYADYVVYFEHNRVLHAVLKGSAKATK